MMKYKLEIIVFICGASVMILELVASRVLAPYVGTSIFVWSNLIGVILASLSLGYWFGGKLSTKNPNKKLLSYILLYAAAFIFLTALLKDVLLYAIHKPIADIRISSLISTIVLFAFPSICLAIITPYAVKLRAVSIEKTGETAGNLFSISTIGSIIGTFFTGFILIPHIGNTKILILLSALLLLCSAIIFFEGFNKTKLSLFLILCVIISFAKFNNTPFINNPGLIDFETAYNRIWIYDSFFRGEPIKVMRINEESNSARFLDKKDLVYPYLKFFRLAKHFNPGFKKTLMIGGAGYTYPVDLITKNPDTTIDVVEIDPAMEKLAKKYFWLREDPRINIFNEDGRVFLNNTKSKYDVILIDAFKSMSILPYQITTREAVQKIFDALNPDGILMANIITSIEGKSGDFLRSELATYKTVFPQIYIFPVDKNDGKYVQNIIIVALKSSAPVSLTSNNKEVNEYLSKVWTKNVPEDMPVLTDDFAPVEYYISRARFK